MLSRLIYGGRVSLMMGVVPVLIASLIGGMLGAVGGFVGGRTNTAIMRTMDVFYAFPSVLLAVAIAGAMGGGMANGMLALTLVFIPPMCRVAETATTQIRALVHHPHPVADVLDNVQIVADEDIDQVELALESA
jgi:peptide/nickel transport system permease protein